MAADGTHIGLLVAPAGTDQHLAGANADLLILPGQCLLQLFDPRLLQVQMDPLGGDLLAGDRVGIELLQNIGHRTDQLQIPPQLEGASSVADLHPQALFDQLQVFVKLAAEGGQGFGVFRFQLQLDGGRCVTGEAIGHRVWLSIEF